MIGLTTDQRRTLSRGMRPLEYFAEDYRIYRRRGLNHQEIAAVMGYGGGEKTVGRLVTRARKAGLLPPYDRRMP